MTSASQVFTRFTPGLLEFALWGFVRVSGNKNVFSSMFFCRENAPKL